MILKESAFKMAGFDSLVLSLLYFNDKQGLFILSPNEYMHLTDKETYAIDDVLEKTKED